MPIPLLVWAGIAVGVMIAGAITASIVKAVTEAPSMDAFFLDNYFYRMLHYVESLGAYFTSIVDEIAMLCFVMALGIGCIKLLFGVHELNKFLVTMFLGIVTYFVMIFGFPHAMVSFKKIMGHWAQYSMATSYSIVNEASSWSANEQQEFMNWLAELGKVQREHEEDEEEGEGYNLYIFNESGALDLNITNRHGNVSLDKMFWVIIKTFSGVWNTNTGGFFWNSIKNLPQILFGMVIAMAYAFAMCFMIIEYCGTLIQYAFLKGVGIIFIPLNLWEGTKQYFGNLISAIFNIMVKLLIVQICLYIVLYSNVDLLRMMYKYGVKGGMSRGGIINELYLGMFATSILVIWIARSAGTIADFLLGNASSKMGADQFQKALNTLKAPVDLAKKGAAKVALGVGGAAKGLHQAGKNAKGAGAQEKGGGPEGGGPGGPGGQGGPGGGGEGGDSKLGDAAEKGTKATGEAVEKGGEAVEKGGDAVDKGGDATMKAGASLSGTGIGALAGVPMMAAGVGMKAAGVGMKVGGKAMQVAGKAIKKAAPLVKSAVAATQAGVSQLAKGVGKSVGNRINDGLNSAANRSTGEILKNGLMGNDEKATAGNTQSHGHDWGNQGGKHKKSQKAMDRQAEAKESGGNEAAEES